MSNKNLAITQPYLFPYLNYFHLLESADKVIFYDDINYIKGGWINRNRILNKNEDLLLTVPVAKASQNKFTNEITPIIDERFVNKAIQSLTHAYSKAPYYSDIMQLIKSVFEKTYTSIADLAINSIVETYKYLGKELCYDRSSICSPKSKGLGKSDRLIKITLEQGYSNYINVKWGQNIHSKDYFRQHGINLLFLESLPYAYKQYNNIFIPSLSIIDVLMFNDKDTIESLMRLYKFD